MQSSLNDVPCATTDTRHLWNDDIWFCKHDVTRDVTDHTTRNTHTHNRFTALLEFVWDHLGEQVPER